MTDHDVSRVRLNVRVDAEIKRRYEAEIRETYGKTDGYAGYEIENELRAHFGRGRIGKLVDAAHDLAEELGETTRKNKIQTPDQGETELVQYRVAEPLKERLDNIEGEEFSSRGEFVGRLMHRYYADGGTIQKAVDRMDRVREAAKEAVGEATDSVERRTQTLVNELGGEETGAFTLDEFRAALDRADEVVNDTAHCRTTYLPRVLNRLSFTWHPENAGLFIPDDEIEVADQDPRRKPYELMDADDRRLTLKYELFANGGFLTVEDAVSVLDGRPQRTTAREDLRAIGDTPGFNHVSADGRIAESAEDGLKLADKQAARQSPDHDDVREYLSGGFTSAHEDETDTPDGPETTTQDGETGGTAAADERSDWVTEAAEMIPDAIDDDPPEPVVKNKIARAKWPAGTDENGSPTHEALDRVTPEMVARVREELADDSPSTDDTAADVETEMDQLMRATPANPTAATDGGRGADD